MTDTAKLTLGELSIDLPVVTGSEGETAVDITQLRAKTGLITIDSGYGNTGACRSSITFIDGDKGILRHRGIPIEQLAEHSRFTEVAWLLIFGQLPTKAQMARFSTRLADNSALHEGFKNHFLGFPDNAQPMAVQSAMISTLACYHQQFLSVESEDAFEEAAARLLSKVRTIAAYTYRRLKGRPFIFPDPKLKYVANFLHMMFSMPYDQYVVEPEVEQALNLILILHADHEQNCSTSTVRMVGSSRANLFASCAAGVCALWGSLHGGANVEVLEQLQTIHDGGLTAEAVIEKAKNKEIRLMGFGHRIYRNFDPRAKILKTSAEKVLNKLGVNDPLLETAMKLEQLALKDPYFVDRQLYPNVDFYSGIIMRAIGIPVDMFTVMFSIGRMPGWIAQWKEQHDDKEARIARPRQIYVGPAQQDYVPMDGR